MGGVAACADIGQLGAEALALTGDHVAGGAPVGVIDAGAAAVVAGEPPAGSEPREMT